MRKGRHGLPFLDQLADYPARRTCVALGRLVPRTEREEQCDAGTRDDVGAGVLK